jgi:imidazoleglycerol-phosphate dehydratase
VSEKRVATKKRETFETKVEVTIDLDGDGNANIDSGIKFFDHMLNQLAKHSGFDLTIKAQGDLEIDEHHTVEDIGITLGDAFLSALGDKKGIKRFANNLAPLDETLVRTALDISGRPYLFTDLNLTREMVGDFPSELTEEFLKSFVNHAKVTLHLDILRGENCHHQIEAVFKSLALALKESTEVVSDKMPSTKGML